MKLGILLATALLSLGCSAAQPPAKTCASVSSVKAHPEGCVRREIRMTAYLISTRHGEYLVDTPDGTDVLSAEVSDGASELLEDLGRANAGNPYASIYGVFEGRLVTDERGKPIKLLINAQVHWQGRVSASGRKRSFAVDVCFRPEA